MKARCTPDHDPFFLALGHRQGFLHTLAAQQARVLQRLNVGQAAQRLQGEGQQEDASSGAPGVGLRGPETRTLALQRLAIVSRLTSLPKFFDVSPRVVGWK